MGRDGGLETGIGVSAGRWVAGGMAITARGVARGGDAGRAGVRGAEPRNARPRSAFEGPAIHDSGQKKTAPRFSKGRPYARLDGG